MLKARTTESPVDLPHADLTSALPLSKSLGLLEKMGEGFARAMDDDFNSREAVAKVLGAVREMMKTLGSGLDATDADAFAHYAVGWLEETAGTVLGVLPTREMALAEPERRPHARQPSLSRLRPCCLSARKLVRQRIGQAQIEFVMNSTPSVSLSSTHLKVPHGTSV